MRSAKELYEYTKQQLGVSIDEFCDELYAEIEDNAKKGYFDCTHTYSLCTIPKTLDGELAIYIAKRKLEELGYTVKITTSEVVSTCYHIRVNWYEI